MSSHRHTRRPHPARRSRPRWSRSGDFFIVSIGHTALDDYAAYVDELLAAGFDQDYKRGDESFSGTNAEGIQVTVHYAGANRMTVRAESLDSKTQQK